MLRRVRPRERYRFGPFQIDATERECRRGDESIPLTGKAFDLLLLLVRAPGRTLTKAELMAALWPETSVEENNLSQTVFLLRSALGDDSERPAYVQTVPRLGFKFVSPVTAVGTSPTTTEAKRSRAWGWLAAAAVVLGALAAGWTVSHFCQPRPLERLAFRLPIELPEGGRFVYGPGPEGGLALSPDGTTAAYAVERAGTTELWIRPLDGASARPLMGTDGAAMPFWSPDNKTVAFFSSSSSGKKLLRVELAGGTPVPICDVPGAPNGGSWSEDGRIIIGSAASGVGLLEVPASGGKAMPLTSLDTSRGETWHHWPQVLPGGHFLYSISGARPENTGVFVASFAKPAERTRLIAEDTNALFAPGGDGKDYLLWRHGSEVVAQHFDLAALKLVAEPRPIADSVRRVNIGMYLALSASGVLLYSAQPSSRRLIWLDRSGRPLGEAGELGTYWNFRISPQGSRVALARLNAAQGLDLWVRETTRGVSTRLTSNPGESHLPVWSPDGQRVLFRYRYDLYVQDANGAGTQQRLTERQAAPGPLDWSRDGRFILFWETGGDTHNDLWVLPMTSNGKAAGDPKPYLRSHFREFHGRFSPEPSPRWVAYQSDESGRWEVYIQSFPEPRGARRISTAGGQYPQWNSNGRELFYVSADNKLMAVSLRTDGDSVEPSRPRELFPMPSQPRGLLEIPYDVAPDGRRFLVQGTDEQRVQALTVVVNWPALLRNEAP